MRLGGVAAGTTSCAPTGAEQQIGKVVIKFCVCSRQNGPKASKIEGIEYNGLDL